MRRFEFTRFPDVPNVRASPSGVVPRNATVEPVSGQ
jgi:hypothetical protein